MCERSQGRSPWGIRSPWSVQPSDFACLRRLTATAVSFQFARVGDDQAAADLLRKIDDDKTIDQYVDCLPGIYRPQNSIASVAANLLIPSGHRSPLGQEDEVGNCRFFLDSFLSQY